MIKTAIHHFSTSGRCEGEDLGPQLWLEQHQGQADHRGHSQQVEGNLSSIAGELTKKSGQCPISGNSS